MYCTTSAYKTNRLVKICLGERRQADSIPRAATQYETHSCTATQPCREVPAGVSRSECSKQGYHAVKGRAVRPFCHHSLYSGAIGASNLLLSPCTKLLNCSKIASRVNRSLFHSELSCQSEMTISKRSISMAVSIF